MPALIADQWTVIKPEWAKRAKKMRAEPKANKTARTAALAA